MGFRLIRKKQPVNHLVVDRLKYANAVPDSKRGVLTHTSVTLPFPKAITSIVTPEPLYTLGGEAGW